MAPTLDDLTSVDLSSHLRLLSPHSLLPARQTRGAHTCSSFSLCLESWPIPWPPLILYSDVFCSMHPNPFPSSLTCSKFSNKKNLMTTKRNSTINQSINLPAKNELVVIKVLLYLCELKYEIIFFNS